MGTLVVCLTGMMAGRMMRRVMKHRSYSRFDDLLMWILGALLGESLAIMGGVTAYGGQVISAGVGAVLLLCLTGLIADRPQTVEKRLPLAIPAEDNSELRPNKMTVEHRRLQRPMRHARFQIPPKIAA